MKKNTAKHQDGIWLYRTEPGRLLTALAVSGAILAAVFLWVHPVFMTIDDARLMYVYAGYSTGEPVSTYLFSYHPLSWILSVLYTYFPKIQWYALYQFGVIGLSNALIGKTIYKMAYRRKICFGVAIGVHIGGYLSAALISTILMHFEITAAMAGAAGVMLLLGIDYDQDRRGVKIADMVMSILCIAASYVIQFNAFYAACCYLLVVLVVAVLTGVREKNAKKVLIQLGCYFLCLAVAVAGVNLIEDNSKDTEQWDTYYQYNKYRVSFWDYPHVSYSEDPETFEQMGWTETFYDLTQQMYFMDERFDKECLEQITERFSWFDAEQLKDAPENFLETMGGLFQSERLVVVQTAMAAVLLLFLLWAMCSKTRWKKYFPQMIGSLCCLMGTAFVLCFLAAKGRLPLRAWLACSIPCLSVVSFLLLSMAEKKEKQDRKKLLRRICAWVLLAGWAAGMVWAYQEIAYEDTLWRRQRTTAQRQMELYVIDHPDNIYVYGLMGAQNYGVFTLYSDENSRPTNAFVWGSSYLFTPAYQQQLEVNGLSQLLTEDLLREDVYFIAGKNTTSAQLLQDLLCEQFGTVEMSAVDEIAGAFYVYQFYLESE